MILDTNKLENVGLTPEQVLFILSIFYRCNFKWDNSADVKHLEELKYIKIIGSRIILRKPSLDLLESLKNNDKLEKVVSYVTQDEIKERIQEYRNIFKGLKIGSMGSKNSCIEKLQKWVKENPEYSFDDILKAANIYIESLSSYQYLQRADYFIYKQDKNGSINSSLSAYIDEINNNIDENWQQTLK